MGAMTYLRIMRNAAATRRTPAVRVRPLAAREIMYTAESWDRASSAWAAAEA